MQTDKMYTQTKKRENNQSQIENMHGAHNSEDIDQQRKIDFEHLKLMIDVQRHMAILSFAGLMLTANFSIKIFPSPDYKSFALFSLLGFFVCILFSLLSQINHIDASKKKTIYRSPLGNKFASPIAINMLGFIIGVVSIAAFILLNWVKLTKV